ncbi:MAG: metallophosphoesterase family protein [Gammaproteobacteria bacterium]
MASYAIGDIHGCLTALQLVVKQLPLTQEDTLILLGDYVDRGPNTKGVIDWILNYEGPAKLVTLRGNHEVMMLSARDNAEKFFTWQHFGGEEALLSYGFEDNSRWQDCVPDSHWAFLENTLPYHANDKQIFVHASVKPKLALEDQESRTLYWKKVSKPRAYSRDHLIICGHTTQYDGEIANFGHTILIDTYAYGDQWLTGINADTLEYWQANEQQEVRTGNLQSYASD